MTNDILEQLSRQSANPVLLVTEQRFGINTSSKLIAVIAFHMHGSTAEEPALDQSSQAACDMAELIIVSHRYFPPSFVCERNQLSGFLLIEGERLLHINMASPFQTELGGIEMASRRGGDVHHVWPGLG